MRHVSPPGGGDAEYAVKRLVRGMCSSRECARQGFASCLAQVLAVLPKDEVNTCQQRVNLADGGGAGIYLFRRPRLCDVSVI